eukprot:CAMPEP_0175063974 /NCGR_PEP_ID=MMETSP0052_2-20121109/15063_1 /TAXON_ID=51329 ORGANISM="Polytomella parva, Strain SAG 63-3" /NCGR_SAMPLE_ID=MMETSP0052_2 /ASSEMBLY_ACC=CAM_ASM_000194 /LENGTH=299 /DNA_ID=CAMNT_0016330249 /DNA_START=333 /DNA_END=1229 /DNA_ORIENTATION=-
MGPYLDFATGHTNFALYSSTASAVTLVFFTEEDLNKGKTTIEVELNPFVNRTGDVWHITLPNLDSTLLYGYRVFGQHQEMEAGAPGLRHDGSKVILDPYAPAVLSRRKFGELAPNLPYSNSVNDRPAPLGLSPTWPQAAGCLPDPLQDDFDWEGDQPPRIPKERLVVYEMHVRGFTQHASSAVQHKGTYAGMTEKLDYLQALGVNAVELLPIFEFNELEYYSPIPLSAKGFGEGRVEGDGIQTSGGTGSSSPDGSAGMAHGMTHTGSRNGRRSDRSSSSTRPSSASSPSPATSSVPPPL